MIEIKSIEDQTTWENYLEKEKEKTFLHSWNWGEFNKKMRNKIWRLGIFENKRLSGIGLFIKNITKRGSFLLCPHGPIFQWKNNKLFFYLVDFIKKIGIKENCLFLRISPFIDRNSENERIFHSLGFIKSPIHTHAEHTWNLDLTPSEDDLLKKMRKTTRYLIRKAQKEGVIIIKSNDIKDLKYFFKLQTETKKRHHFTPFSEEYIRNEFLSFSRNNQILLFLAKYRNNIIASAIFIYWQKISFYHHGASSIKYPKIPAAYLLQWEAIREAKNRQCSLHNFWGITDLKNRHHPWYGLTLFKTGFGGYEKKLVVSHDLPLKATYWLTYIFEKIRKWKRGYGIN